MEQVIIPKARWVRVIPITFLMYTISMMDRNNISFAISGIEKTLGIGATLSGLAAGIFFIGYLFLQIPSGILVGKFGSRKLVPIILIFWGTFAILTGLVTNVTELLIIRFLIGFAEGACLPAITMTLTRWFPIQERGRANSIWMMSVPFASLVMSPISGYILTVSNWRTMFFIEGIPPFIWAVIWWMFMADSPSEAKWLSKEERDYLVSTIDLEKEAIQGSVGLKQMLFNRNVVLLVIAWFLMQMGYNGFTMWLPTVIKTVSHGSNSTVGWLSSLPWLASICGMYLISRHSDKTAERKGHVAFSVVLAGIFLACSALISHYSPVMSIVTIILCGGFVVSYNGIWWAIPSTFLQGEVLGAAFGLINSVGNLGGFFGPTVVGTLDSHTGNFTSGILFLSIILVISAIFVLMVKYENPVGLAKNTKQNLQQQL